MTRSKASPAKARSHRATVDRIEGDIAVVEIDGAEVTLAVRLLPTGAREGDRLTITLAIDARGTQRAKDGIEQLRKRVGSDDDGSDFSL